MVWEAIRLGVLCVLSPPGLPAVRARVLGLLKGELDACPGMGWGCGRLIDWLALGWFGWDGVHYGFLFSVWDVR